MPNGYYNQHYGVNRYVSGKQITNDDKKTKMKEAELDRRKFITLGLSGLMNMGNTCYFNSVIQLLSNCPLLFAKFKDPSIIDNIVRKNIYDNIQKIKDDNILLDEDSKLEIDKEKFKNEIEDTLTFQLHKVVKTMWEKNHLVRPRSLKETIAKHPTLAGYGQQDAQEALQFILDHIHDETSYNVKDTQFKEEIVAKILPNIEKVKECSKIIDESKNIDDKKLASDTLMNMYNSDPDTYLMMMAVVQWKSFLAREGESDFTHLIWGLTCTKRTCKKCKFMSPKFEMFNMIQLTIPKDNKNLTIQNCFNHHFIKQDIECKCSRCEYKMAEEESFIYVYPSVFFIQLKRFEHYYDKKLFRLVSSKVTDRIEFPLKNMSFKEKGISTEGKEVNISYDLKGVVEHRGNIDGGHYVSYCENPVSSTQEWFEFNDDDVLRIPKDELEKELVTSNAYLLMYQKNDNIFDEDDEDDEEEVEENNDEFTTPVPKD
uniref:USP domain-containing protein n=1 Tax=viral metagenome TaxID=1070528 RepID=A0A6C0ADB9_9ZZZZ